MVGGYGVRLGTEKKRTRGLGGGKKDSPTGEEVRDSDEK